MFSYNVLSVTGFVLVYCALSFALVRIVETNRDLSTISLVILSLLAAAYLVIVGIAIYHRSVQVNKHFGLRRRKK